MSTLSAKFSLLNKLINRVCDIIPKNNDLQDVKRNIICEANLFCYGLRGITKCKR